MVNSIIPNRILLIHSQNSLGTKRAGEIKTHLAQVRRKYNYSITTFEDNDNNSSTSEELFNLELISNSKIVIILFEKELVDNDYFFKTCLPILNDQSQSGNIVIPVLIGHIDNADNLGVFKYASPFYSHHSEEQTLVDSDEKMVKLVEFVRRYIESQVVN